MLFAKCRRIQACLLLVLLVLVFLSQCEAKKRRVKKHSNKMVLRQKETNAVNFIRLAVMRLIYGLATRFGFGEQIAGALNGAFIPPGVEPDYDDYGGYDDGFDILNRDDEYDY